jgi:hypothetical protein
MFRPADRAGASRVPILIKPPATAEVEGLVLNFAEFVSIIGKT